MFVLNLCLGRREAINNAVIKQYLTRSNLRPIALILHPYLSR
jgi:hypothetical protein